MVWEALVRALANPVMLRAVVVFFFATFAFFLGVVFMRLLRRSIDEDSDISSDAKPSLETLPMHLYNTVIQQLKQQKHELQVQTQIEQRRARTTENFSQAVLSNLSSGVLVFGTNGLVKQTNPAAKEILGFASPTGMSAEDIFRGAEISRNAELNSTDGVDEGAAAPCRLAEEVQSVLKEGSGRRHVEADYTTPAGEKRHIAATVSPVPSVDGSLLGAACLINDLSEFERIRQQQELQNEISAEKALDLRTSLATISGYAQQLSNSRDAELVAQLAADIADEANRLNQSIGGFLSEKSAPKTAAARANSAGRG
jgi:PAS domain-containing protein